MINEKYDGRIQEFHLYLREENSVGRGSRLDYRKYVYQILEEYGNVENVEVSELGNHKKAAYNKFLKFLGERNEN